MRGIPRSLARWRVRRYRDLAYTIDWTIDARARRLAGSVAIELTIARAVDIVLDWRPPEGARARIASVNGRAIDARSFADHLIVPAAATLAGANRIVISMVAPIRPAGTPITRYRDGEDGHDYVYTLLVPADASTLFPCFDQPDLKARFTLALGHPAGWRVIGNAPIVARAARQHRFAATEPISTYLFAFAAGPFARIAGDGATAALFVRTSQRARARRSAREALALADGAVDFCARYTGLRLPFAKYDLVLIPEFQYGGMEHAGATFLREEAIVLARDATSAARQRRAMLVAHETAHQWFGDLVTMRWFDDLWLKEGFANFMAAKVIDALEPALAPWIAVLAQKSLAYRTDATRGTHPLVAPVGNLLDAKAAYGTIVYQKAPAVLRMAEHMLGAATFRRAVRAWLRDHAYAAADRDDLIEALERVSGVRLARWSRAWISGAGVPTVRLTLRLNERGQVRIARLVQRPAPRGARRPVPIAFDLLVRGPRGGARRLDVRLVTRSARLAALENRPAPLALLLNAADAAYARFIDDPHRLANPRDEADPLVRARIVEAHWEALHEGAIAPPAFVARLLALLELECTPAIVGLALERLEVASRWFCSADEQADAAARVAATLDALDARKIEPVAVARTRIAVTCTPDGIARLERRRRALRGAAHFDERIAIIERSAMLGLPLAKTALAAERLFATTDTARRRVFAAGAAFPAPAIKARYFERFLADRSLPESWIEAALPRLACPEHAQAMLVVLPRALAAMPELQRRFRIFFVNRWLDAFVGSQTSPAALAIVERAARSAPRSSPLRAKLRESADALARRVTIRDAPRGDIPIQSYSSHNGRKL